MFPMMAAIKWLFVFSLGKGRTCQLLILVWPSVEKNENPVIVIGGYRWGSKRKSLWWGFVWGGVRQEDHLAFCSYTPVSNAEIAKLTATPQLIKTQTAEEERMDV